MRLRDGHGQVDVDDEQQRIGGLDGAGSVRGQHLLGALRRVQLGHHLVGVHRAGTSVQGHRTDVQHHVDGAQGSATEPHRGTAAADRAVDGDVLGPEARKPPVNGRSSRADESFVPVFPGPGAAEHGRRL